MLMISIVTVCAPGHFHLIYEPSSKNRSADGIIYMRDRVIGAQIGACYMRFANTKKIPTIECAYKRGKCATRA